MCDITYPKFPCRIYEKTWNTWKGIKPFISLKTVASNVPTVLSLAIFDSHLSYCCLVWAQKFSSIKRILILQKKLLELLISNKGIPIPVPYSSKISS